MRDGIWGLLGPHRKEYAGHNPAVTPFQPPQYGGGLDEILRPFELSPLSLQGLQPT